MLETDFRYLVAEPTIPPGFRSLTWLPFLAAVVVTNYSWVSVPAASTDTEGTGGKPVQRSYVEPPIGGVLFGQSRFQCPPFRELGPASSRLEDALEWPIHS
ncbi:hypothetical protein KM043_005535 [Ampulex compressa]|nr:hypothetical protein KM043_005535 [Ampulex compressa]